MSHETLPAPVATVDIPENNKNLHKVVKWDTLSAIAVKSWTTVVELARINNISDPNKIRIGQEIYLTQEAKTTANDTANKYVETRKTALQRAKGAEEKDKLWNKIPIDWKDKEWESIPGTVKLALLGLNNPDEVLGFDLYIIQKYKPFGGNSPEEAWNKYQAVYDSDPSKAPGLLDKYCTNAYVQEYKQYRVNQDESIKKEQKKYYSLEQFHQDMWLSVMPPSVSEVHQFVNSYNVWLRQNRKTHSSDTLETYKKIYIAQKQANKSEG